LKTHRGDFVDALNEEYYHVRRYRDQFNKWLQFHQVQDQTMGLYKHLSYLYYKLRKLTNIGF
jgi:hypothetical protein